jgi:2-oxo-4-hydroxy-4-carboxy--5-ureidoimidazoline (OHCU) decarboxylase
MRTPELPAIENLNALDRDAFVSAVGPLFEGASAFLARLADARPFEDDAALIGAAYQVARELPRDEAIELVNTHPRIGGDPAAMSRLSRAEQGDGDAESDDASDGAWVAEELAGLNEVYETRFGFRYAVFVAGRPQAEIIPLLEASLRNDPAAELRRAVDECVAIGEDRLQTLRGATPDKAPDGTDDDA